MKNKYVAVKLEEMKEITGGGSIVSVPVVNGWYVVGHGFIRRGRRL